MLFQDNLLGWLGKDGGGGGRYPVTKSSSSAEPVIYPASQMLLSSLFQQHLQLTQLLKPGVLGKCKYDHSENLPFRTCGGASTFRLAGILQKGVSSFTAKFSLNKLINLPYKTIFLEGTWIFGFNWVVVSLFFSVFPSPTNLSDDNTFNQIPLDFIHLWLVCLLKLPHTSLGWTRLCSF